MVVAETGNAGYIMRGESKGRNGFENIQIHVVQPAGIKGEIKNVAGP